jgi:hypothetical protein
MKLVVWMRVLDTVFRADVQFQLGLVSLVRDTATALHPAQWEGSLIRRREISDAGQELLLSDRTRRKGLSCGRTDYLALPNQSSGSKKRPALESSHGSPQRKRG